MVQEIPPSAQAPASVQAPTASAEAPATVEGNSKVASILTFIFGLCMILSLFFFAWSVADMHIHADGSLSQGYYDYYDVYIYTSSHLNEDVFWPAFGFALTTLPLAIVSLVFSVKQNKRIQTLFNAIVRVVASTALITLLIILADSI